MTDEPTPDPPATDPDSIEGRRAFLTRYWTALTTGELDDFAPLVHEDCVVHYPGNHVLSGDHVGRTAILALYDRLYRIGIKQGTFVGELHDVVFSDVHACALVTYTLHLGAGQTLTGEAVGVFHIEGGQMTEYWLLERDQRMINDIFALSGKAALSGGGAVAMAKGVLLHPAAAFRIGRRLIRRRRGTSTKML